jgi:archaellum component FlaF (FlaF/FlaG flagellin family)
MDNAIPSMLVGAILLTAMAIIGRGSLLTYDRVGMSFRDMEARLVEKSTTDLSVTDAAVDITGQYVTITLLNDGSTRVGTVEDLDVIVSYFTALGGQANIWLPFEASGLTANTWSLLTILNDDHEPGILNPGESAEIVLNLSPGVAVGPSNSLVISTEIGATTAASFSRAI